MPSTRPTFWGSSVVKKALTDRAEAQRQSWQTSLQAIRASAAATIHQARGEVDASMPPFATLLPKPRKPKPRLGRFLRSAMKKGHLSRRIYVFVTAVLSDLHEQLL
ncbi:MAG: hypothetical protein ABIL01_12175 [Pseudomonadota bacterium]|jgi:hypothetical protein